MEVRNLAASDRPRALYRYRVTGSSTFPLDMLRYDSAWPSRQESVISIIGKDHRTIELSSYHRPTAARWASFGWKVEEGPQTVFRA